MTPRTDQPPQPTTGGGAAVEAGAVGARVRALREGMALSLRDLAERSGVSAATLSQVERGESSPTLTVAGRIADGLELSLSQLLRLDEGGHVLITRAGTGRSRSRSGHTVEELTPPLPGLRADVSRHVLEAGAATGGSDDPPMHEPGSRETIVVLGGELQLLVDGAEHPLRAGDSATFDADLAHRISNPGPGPASLLAVVAAGLRRS